MSSLLQQLANNEAILLMYLADELPAEDRAEVEQLLATDAALRQELQHLREAHEAMHEVLSSADGAAPAPLAQAVAVRSVGRAMRQWQVQRLIPAAPALLPRGLRYPWWTYPLATAAAVLFALLAWWGNRPEGVGSPRLSPDYQALPQVADARSPLIELEQHELADRLERSFDDTEELFEDMTRYPLLFEAEQHLVALRTGETDPWEQLAY